MTSRVRCSCGRIYDPVKHNTCPDCGAESAVESVVVAEKAKPPTPPEPATEKRPVAQIPPVDFGAIIRSLPRPVYGVAGAVVLLLLVLLFRHHGPDNRTAASNERSTPSGEQKTSPGPSAAQTSPAETVPGWATPPPLGPTAPPGAPTFPPNMVVPGLTVANLGELIKKAGPNGTVTLKPGMYQGGAIVIQPVRIVGENGSQVFIQSDTKDALSVKSKGVVLQNVQVLFNGAGEAAAVTVGDNGELETDGVKIMSSSSYGLIVSGNGLIKATSSTFTSTGGTAALIDRQSHANFTKCSFTDAQIGLNVGHGSSAELHSCAFERTGARTGRGAIIAISGDKSGVSAESCRFASNPGGIAVGEGGSLVVSNSQFKDNGTSSVQGNSGLGLVQVRGGATVKLDGDTFETNAQGVVATNGGVMEIDKCRFDGTGLQTRGELINGCMAVSTNGQGSSVTLRNSSIAGNASYNVAVIWSARLKMEDTDVSGARTVGLLVGDRNGLPAVAEVKHCKFLRNTTGIGVSAGSSATITDSESRENSEGVIALDRGSRVVLTKAVLMGNREHGLCVYGGAEAQATDSRIENNGRGAQSGMHKGSMTGGSLVLQNTRVAGNQIFGVGAYAKNQLSLSGVTFEGNGKTNIYRENGAIVRTDGGVDPGQAQTANTDENDQGGGQDSSKRSHKKRQMTDDDARRIIRRFFPGQ